MTQPASELSAKLPRDAFRVRTKNRSARLDDEPTETEQTYLTVNGTPNGFRWFAKLLTELATNADANSWDQVIVSGSDLDSVSLQGWGSMHLQCDCYPNANNDGD